MTGINASDDRKLMLAERDLISDALKQVNLSAVWSFENSRISCGALQKDASALNHESAIRLSTTPSIPVLILRKGVIAPVETIELQEAKLIVRLLNDNLIYISLANEIPTTVLYGVLYIYCKVPQINFFQKYAPISR